MTNTKWALVIHIAYEVISNIKATRKSYHPIELKK